MRLNLNALRVYYWVARLGSFTGAAEQLFISQPAVSKAVKELEHSLSLSLIVRSSSTRTLMLTEAGKTLFEHARGIFAIEKSAVEDMALMANAGKGSLTVGASTTVASYWLPSYLAEFRAKYPDIHLELVVANSRDIEQKLLDAQLDVALVEGPSHIQSIQVIPWVKESMGLWVSYSEKFNARDCTWLLREEGSGTREVALSIIKNNGWKVEKEIRLGSNEAIARAVSQGLGVSFLPDIVCDELSQLKKIHRVIETNVNARTLFFLRLNQRPFTPSAKHFFNLLFSDK